MKGLRWWIGGMLFAVTILNYIDRQTLSVLAPILQQEYHWSNSDFATILIAFRVAYTIMQSVFGRVLDRIGTRRGMILSVTFYSVVEVLTASAQGIMGFRVFRFLLGPGEAANNPGAAKAVSEWFPAQERAWAVALFDSGSSIGGAVAPFLLSSFWIRRGWPVGRARRAVLIVFGPSMLVLIPAAFSSCYVLLMLLFAYASFAYAACSTMFLSLPADVFHTRAVGSVSGMGGTGAGIGTLISTYLIGRVTDRLSFQPVIIAASIIPCVATLVFVSLVRARKEPDPDGVVLSF